MGLTKTVELHTWPGGTSWCAIVYDEDRDRIGYWYGTREECEAVDPAIVRFHRAGESS